MDKYCEKRYKTPCPPTHTNSAVFVYRVFAVFAHEFLEKRTITGHQRPNQWSTATNVPTSNHSIKHIDEHTNTWTGFFRNTFAFFFKPNSPPTVHELRTPSCALWTYTACLSEKRTETPHIPTHTGHAVFSLRFFDLLLLNFGRKEMMQWWFPFTLSRDSSDQCDVSKLWQTWSLQQLLSRHQRSVALYLYSLNVL